MWFLDNAWLIPVLPAVSFVLILLFGKRSGRLTNYGAYLGVLAVGVSLILSIGVGYQWIQRVDDAHGGGGEHSAISVLSAFGRSSPVLAAEEGGEGGHGEEGGHEKVVVEPVVSTWTWIDTGEAEVTIGTYIDGLAAALLIVVAIISLLVHIFSLEYVRGDERFTFYYAGLSLFTTGMFTLVVAQSTLQLLLGWEIMGLCSFLLIGHWWEEKRNSRAAMKAFFTTRSGDVGLLLGIIVLFFGVGSFGIGETNLWALSPDASHRTLLIASVFLMIAIIGKSGQFPLHTWLPDAMAGPTPVSALIHAATMVVAGVYLGARIYPVFFEGFSVASGNPNMMATIGAITVVIAAVLAFVQNDIKKVLAYSTVSQLGYMVMGLGVGAWVAAVFHICTHAFFKALLFLGSGSVAHSGSHHSFDMKKDMGGLWRKMPITFTTFIIGTLALMGIFPLSGFWSKDEILATAGNNGYDAYLLVGLVGAGLTAAYMTRCVYLTFLGTYRGGADEDTEAVALSAEHGELDEAGHLLAHDAAHPDPHAAHGGGHGGHGDDHGHHAEPHESPPLLTVPLIILAVLAIGAGWVQMPWEVLKVEKFLEYVEPTFAFPGLEHAAFNTALAIISVTLAVLSSLFVYFLLRNDFGFLKGLTKRSKTAHAGYTFLVNKYYLDDLYENVIVRSIAGPIARACGWFNNVVIDGVVNGAGSMSAWVGRWTYRYLDQGLVDGIVNGAGTVAEETGGALRPTQSGRVAQYTAILFAAAALGALILVLVIV